MTRALRVVAFVGNKGGIGKTTLAVNLAVLLRTLHPDLPVLLLGLDDHDVIDRMFRLEDEPTGPDVLAALRAGDLGGAIRRGRYDVHYVPTSTHVSELKREWSGPHHLAEALAWSGWSGLALVDAKSDLEGLTQNAIWASDLTVLPVTDHTSLVEAGKVFRLLDGWGRERTRARIALSLVDLRIKYTDAEHRDVLGLLLAQIRAQGLPLFESFVSRSPRIEALNTNVGGRPLPICQRERGSLVDAQLRHLASELLRALDEAVAEQAARGERRREPRQAFPQRLVAFPEQGPELVEIEARDLSRSGVGTAQAVDGAPGARVHLALPGPARVPALIWARVLRSGPPGALLFEPPHGAAAAALAALLAAPQAGAGGDSVA